MTPLQSLITHACMSVAKANEGISIISDEALAIHGMSTAKVRHLVNNLCSLPDCRYLEVGSWKGSTLCAALDGNLLQRVTAYENFAEFTDAGHCDGPLSIREQLTANIARHRGENQVELIEADFFTHPAAAGAAYNVYLYDGAHSQQTQYRQFQKAKPLLDRYAIVLVDDWFCEVSRPKEMTFRACNDFGFYIHAFVELPKGNDGYWGGQGLLVVENL